MPFADRSVGGDRVDAHKDGHKEVHKEVHKQQPPETNFERSALVRALRLGLKQRLSPSRL
jgi:hypothetical protein